MVSNNMINVIYYRNHNRLTVSGHAGSAEPGRDLICASASILAMTLAENVLHICDSGCADNPVTVLREGNAEISCRPMHRYKDSVQQVFMSVCVGFEILASKFPEYVTYSVRG